MIVSVMGKYRLEYVVTDIVEIPDDEVAGMSDEEIEDVALSIALDRVDPDNYIREDCDGLEVQIVKEK